MFNKFKHYLNYHFLIEFLLSTFFILTIFASKIPASDGTFQFKLSIFPILLTIFFSIYFKIGKHTFKSIVNTSEFRSLGLLIIIFIVFHSIGLIYSKNLNYGFQKFYGIIFNIIPVFIFTYFIIKTWNKRRTEAFLFSSSILICLSVIYILIVFPFNYGNVRTISTNSWSHVYYGRFISLSYIIYLLIYLRNYNGTKKYYFILLLIFCTIGTFASGLRAAEIGIILFTVSIGLYLFIKKKIKPNRIILTIGLIIISFSSVLLISNNKLNTRQNDLIKLTQLDINEISSLDARYKGLEAGIAMFKENPIIGVGLGGFNNKKYGEALTEIKYPHNIFLEYLFEYGLAGLIIFSIILFILLRKLNSISKDVLILFLFTIWLSLFSHDISSQKELYIFVVFYIIDREEFEQFKINLCKT